MSTSTDLLFLHAETPLHPGSGSALGAIDLPVARERHTLWPYIPASSLKGVLRDHCRQTLGGESKSSKLWILFGPDTKNASDHAGALTISDSRLLAYPVRSLKGLFAWVTCPAAIQRLARDARMAGRSEILAGANALLKVADGLSDEKAFTASESLLIKNKAVFEEFEYAAQKSPELASLGKQVDSLLGDGTRLESHLAIVSDDCFTHYVRFATEVMARIALDYDTKTVTDGALFYEEHIPAGAVFYSHVGADSERCEKKAGEERMTSSTVLAALKGAFAEDSFIQVGANATTGKGICAITFASKGDG